MAKGIGLKIPDTIVTNSKAVLQDFVSKHNAVICKACCENLSFQFYNVAFMQYVEVLSDTDIQGVPEIFFPTLFQERIPNEINVRAFYLNGKIYSTGIIQKKLIDYRADFENRRTIPIQLPFEVEQNIIELMKILELNTGGIDLIKGKDGFYFLEINPNGYFGRNSKMCNYYLEEKIASFFV